MEVRSNRMQFLVWAIGIVPCFGAILLMILRGKQNSGHNGFLIKDLGAVEFALVLGLTGYFLWNIYRYFFDSKPRLQIDLSGIKEERMEPILWSEISYFYTTNEAIEGMNSYFLFIRLNDPLTLKDPPIRIRLENTEQTFKAIRDCIELYAASNGIRDMGHDTVPYN